MNQLKYCRTISVLKDTLHGSGRSAVRQSCVTVSRRRRSASVSSPMTRWFTQRTQ